MKEMLVVHLDLCISCGACERACAKRHGVSRIKVKNLSGRIGIIGLPVVCVHCEDPPCMKACEEGAIKRDNSIVYTDSDECTGCGACIYACPFGAIIIRYEKIKKWSGLKTETVKIADRCDMCQGYDESACAQACPKDALERVDVEEFGKEKLQKYVEQLSKLLTKTSPF